VTKYVHVSHVKLYDGRGKFVGGVPIFAHYLAQAIPELVQYSFADYPKWMDHDRATEPQRAEVLNAWLLETGAVDQDTVVIADGYWGVGLEGRVGRLISVIHGSYYGRLLQSQIYPWGEVVQMYDVTAQLAFWKQPEVELVGVCKSVVDEIMLYDKSYARAIVVNNSVPVDGDGYFPVETEGDLVAMHGATGMIKGADNIGYMVREAGCVIENFGISTEFASHKRKRFSECSFLVAPTHYEGNPYMWLEAMACGVPVLGSTVGIGREIPRTVSVMLDDRSPANFIRWYKDMDKGRGYLDPRQWVVDNCAIEQFNAGWREICNVS